ncbi:succinylglutamate desuccinylase [Kangiella profundi]|uniref:Succinylglutamate desuccinylase n=1 Tax=Kangiella profundi TaxID=1561924 RepID=A0A2K9AEX3_9GAMM|nr:succinylglutamate desuccinylase [Kangiella profundi]AUD78936.1 succinylglutamate desuccinylase [Kangiella profundi]GGF02862.1 succinylglutamate desuccinylase [Kangiella profundi]
MLTTQDFNTFNFIDFVRQNPEQHERFELKIEQGKAIFHDAGIIEFVPNQLSDQFVCLSCGVHGNETAPMEIISDMVRDILVGSQALSVNLLILLGNPKAMQQQERFLEFNLNRMFNHHWKSYLEADAHCYEALRAKRLEEAVQDFFDKSPADSRRYHYDLHTAIRASKHQRFAIYPYLDGREHKVEQLAFMQDCGVNTVLLYHKASSTFSYHTSHHFKADAFTVELGKVKPFGGNNREDFEQAENSLRQLVASNYHFNNDREIDDLNLFAVKKELLRVSDDSHLNVDDDLANFTEFEQGFELLSDPAEPYSIESNGEAIVFPNNKVPIGQRMALLVEPVSLG